MGDVADKMPKLAVPWLASANAAPTTPKKASKHKKNSKAQEEKHVNDEICWLKSSF